MSIRVHRLHPWNTDARDATALQRELASRVVLAPPRWGRRPTAIRVAAADVSCPRGSKAVVAAVVCVELPGFDLLEVSRTEMPAPFPYVPGLLSFREAPAVLEAIERLHTRFEALICDGQGVAHPRGLGLASHVGLCVGAPTVGCAKSRLCGEHGEVGPRRGDSVPLLLNGRRVGRVLRTRDGTKPLYVSPGHLIDVRGAVDLVMACSGRYRLPEPCRMAHQAAGWRGGTERLLEVLRGQHH